MQVPNTHIYTQRPILRVLTLKRKKNQSECKSEKGERIEEKRQSRKKEIDELKSFQVYLL